NPLREEESGNDITHIIPPEAVEEKAENPHVAYGEFLDRAKKADEGPRYDRSSCVDCVFLGRFHQLDLYHCKLFSVVIAYNAAHASEWYHYNTTPTQP